VTTDVPRISAKLRGTLVRRGTVASHGNRTVPIPALTSWICNRRRPAGHASHWPR
jgi:hypothetical protein